MRFYLPTQDTPKPKKEDEKSEDPEEEKKEEKVSKAEYGGTLMNRRRKIQKVKKR